MTNTKLNYSKEVTHDGIDLFITNLSKGKAKMFINTLNALKKEMNGYPLKWKLNKEMSPHPVYGTEQKITITARYPDVTYTGEQLVFALTQNRMLIETGLKQLGLKDAVYEGSEFYCDQPAILETA